MGQIRRVTLSKQVLEGIVDILRTGDYKVGDKIPTEKELSESLGVGRNSIREGMKALALGDVIESTPGKGTFLKKRVVDIMIRPDGILDVINNNSVSLRELMQVRMIFEVETAGLAAEMASENTRELQAFKKAWQDLNKALKERKDCTEQGHEYHRAIVNLGGNNLLKKLLNPIWEEMRIARKFDPVVEEERFEVERYYHDKIYHAIVDGKPEEARRLMREHLIDETGKKGFTKKK
ncbi:MAG: FadR/GntR family transcriptional regulator [Oscillospiraceae bacterium]